MLIPLLNSFRGWNDHRLNVLQKCLLVSLLLHVLFTIGLSFVVVTHQVIAFAKPVAYVYGDSHYFRIDKPFQSAQGQRLENFTRVETFGDNQANGNNDVHWLKVLVDPGSREVFAYQPQIVPANRTAVPAP